MLSHNHGLNRPTAMGGSAAPAPGPPAVMMMTKVRIVAGGVHISRHEARGSRGGWRAVGLASLSRRRYPSPFDFKQSRHDRHRHHRHRIRPASTAIGGGTWPSPHGSLRLFDCCFCFFWRCCAVAITPLPPLTARSCRRCRCRLPSPLLSNVIAVEITQYRSPAIVATTFANDVAQLLLPSTTPPPPPFLFDCCVCFYFLRRYLAVTPSHHRLAQSRRCCCHRAVASLPPLPSHRCRY